MRPRATTAGAKRDHGARQRSSRTQIRHASARLGDRRAARRWLRAHRAPGTPLVLRVGLTITKYGDFYMAGRSFNAALGLAFLVACSHPPVEDAEQPSGDPPVG